MMLEISDISTCGDDSQHAGYSHRHDGSHNGQVPTAIMIPRSLGTQMTSHSSNAARSMPITTHGTVHRAQPASDLVISFEDDDELEFMAVPPEREERDTSYRPGGSSRSGAKKSFNKRSSGFHTDFRNVTVSKPLRKGKHRPRPWNSLKGDTRDRREDLISGVICRHWPQAEAKWETFPFVPCRPDGTLLEMRDCTDSFLSNLAALAAKTPGDMDGAMRLLHEAATYEPEGTPDLSDIVIARACHWHEARQQMTLHALEGPTGGPGTQRDPSHHASEPVAGEPTLMSTLATTPQTFQSPPAGSEPPLASPNNSNRPSPIVPQSVGVLGPLEANARARAKKKLKRRIEDLKAYLERKDALDEMRTAERLMEDMDSQSD